MFHINEGSVNFSNVLEAGTPYPPLYNTLFANVANSVVVDSVAKAIFGFVLLFTIIQVFFSEDKKDAAKTLGTYIMIYCLFYFPWVRGNYLFPALTNIIDQGMKQACQMGAKGFSPANLADQSAIPEIASNALDQALRSNDTLRNGLSDFYNACYTNAKSRYYLDHSKDPATQNIVPSSKELDSYYSAQDLTVNGVQCAEAKNSYLYAANSNYKKVVDDRLDVYQSKKITGGGSMEGKQGLSANGQQMKQMLDNSMAREDFQASVFDTAVTSASTVNTNPAGTSEDTRGWWTRKWDVVKDISGSWVLGIARALFLGICATAQWFVDRHLYDIVGIIKCCVAMSFGWLFLYSLFTLNAAPLLKLLGLWLFADALYLIAALNMTLWASWQPAGGGLTTPFLYAGSLLGLETAFSHQQAMSGFLYLFMFTLAGIFSWNALMGGGVLFGSFASGIGGQLSALHSMSRLKQASK